MFKYITSNTVVQICVKACLSLCVYQSGKSALHIASEKRYLDMVQALLLQGAEVNLADAISQLISAVSVHTYMCPDCACELVCSCMCVCVSMRLTKYSLQSFAQTKSRLVGKYLADKYQGHGWWRIIMGLLIVILLANGSETPCSWLEDNQKVNTICHSSGKYLSIRSAFAMSQLAIVSLVIL